MHVQIGSAVPDKVLALFDTSFHAEHDSGLAGDGYVSGKYIHIPSVM